MSVKKLLFVDTNILLDFYRARNEAGLSLLEHLEQIADRVITTFQLEMEFRKNRHSAIAEGLTELKPQQGIARPGLFSDAKAIQAIRASQKRADARIKQLRARYLKALEDPVRNDPVYKTCQRIFHKDDPLVLKLGDPLRHSVRRKAFRRFLLGCPPRKRNDTTIGDAINWEWMIHCALSRNAELVIVSRDSDYGMTYDGQSFINDHLRQEFSERVSRKRKILLYSKLSDALKHFQIQVSEKEKQAEEEIVLLPKEVSASSFMAEASAMAAPPLSSMGERFREMLLQQDDRIRERASALAQAISKHEIHQAAVSKIAEALAGNEKQRLALTKIVEAITAGTAKTHASKAEQKPAEESLPADMQSRNQN